LLAIRDGVLAVTHPDAFGTSAGRTIVDTNASLQLSGNFWVREKALTLNSSHPFAILSFGSNAWSGLITLQRTVNIGVSTFSFLNFMSFFDCCPAVISGPGGITKVGSGTLTISGFYPNDYTGPTVVNDGVLEAWRLVSPALPGDVVVTGASSVLRMGRLPSSTALGFRASVAVENGALWMMNPTNNETVRSLSGNGRLVLSNAASLTVDNTNSCELSGAISGTGALNKRGTATLLLSGQSPLYGGASTVFEGTLKVDGRLSGSPVTVKGGAQLRGDGSVGNVTAEQDSVIQGDASFTEHPDRQAGDFEVANLTMDHGSGVGTAIFGPSSTGGNDLLIAKGQVTLGNARLSSGFKYPPREGDQVMVLRKDSTGAINGVFEGWPEGIIRKLGDVTVRASYLGGSGNDFVLTVTNVPLQFSSYRLAEGNGNQTVEPDECALVFVSLRNRGTSSLTITNALLRATTPDTAVTIANAAYPAIPGGATRENR
jgi:autotransporter-associated beta strand protein